MEQAGLLHRHGGVRPLSQGPAWSDPSAWSGPPGSGPAGPQDERWGGALRRDGAGEWLGVGCQERDLSGAPCASTRDRGTGTGCPGWPVSGEGPPVLSGGCAFPASGQLGWANDMGIMSLASAHLLASAARVPWREPGACWPSSDLPSQHLPPLSMPLLCPQYDGVLLGRTQREPLGHPNRARAAAPSCHQPCAQ